MGNVLKMDQQQIIQGLINLGWSNRRIHAETGIYRDTISRYGKIFESGPKVPTDFSIQNRPIVPTDPPRYPGTKSQQVIPYIKNIWKLYIAGHTAQRIYQDLVEEQSYPGSYDSIKRYVRKFRKHYPTHYEHLRKAPGKEAQVDFAKGPPVLFNGRYKRCWLFKLTLNFSGHSYEELVWKQDLETFIRCHENAFRSFDGIPETVKLDNLKSGVLKACLYEPQINPVYLSFAKHCGFVPNPCAPYKPEHKGKVERDVQYTKSNALKGRRFTSLAEGNLFLKHWNKKWARTRIHGTTRTQVWKLFAELEKPVLRSCPQPFSLFKVSQRKVDVYGHMEVGTNFYSVPHYYIGQRLRVHYNSQFVKIYDSSNKLIASHKTLPGKGKYVTAYGHKPPYKPQSLEEAEGWLVKKAKLIGPQCHRLIYKILCTEDVLAVRRCRGILSLQKKYGIKLLDESCGQALLSQRYTYKHVQTICESLQQNGKTMQPVLTQVHDLIRDAGYYQSFIEERSC